MLINRLNNYNPLKTEKIEEKTRVLKSAKKLFDVRDEIINLSKKGTFPYNDKISKTEEKKKNQKKN